MKRVFKIIFWIFIITIGLWIYFFSRLDQLLLNLILINIIVYVLRTILIEVLNSLVKNLLSRYIFIIIVNIIWIVFVFLLLFELDPIYSITILSFLIVAISLTFQGIINNIVSGILLLSSGGFEVGDLIQTNNIDGIIKEITLNHIKLMDFDGSITYIPNRVVFNSSITRYSHIELNKFDKLDLTNVIKKVKKAFIGKKKLTRYIKAVELLGSVNGERIDELLEPVLKKYEPIFGIKPYFYVNYTIADRLSITLQILSKDPKLILEFFDPFLKDILFQIYQDEINFDWNNNTKTQLR